MKIYAWGTQQFKHASMSMRDQTAQARKYLHERPNMRCASLHYSHTPPRRKMSHSGLVSVVILSLWNILILKAWFQPLGLNDFKGTIRPSEILFYQQIKAKQEPKSVQYWSWIESLLGNYLILKIPFWQMEYCRTIQKMHHFPSWKKISSRKIFLKIFCMSKSNIIFLSNLVFT
jgi:hypothetical protein